MNTPLFRSRYTLAEHFENGMDGGGILLNAFSGAVDTCPPELIDLIRSSRELDPVAARPYRDFLLDRGYYVESAEAEDAVARAVMVRAKSRARESATPKYMFGVSLKCNLSCHYCWQVIEHGNERQKTALMTPPMVDAAFHYIRDELARLGKNTANISLFGGEPLIDWMPMRKLVRSVGERTKAAGYHLHFTTNGRDLSTFREEIAEFRPSIQVTIDDAYQRNGTMVLARAEQELVGLLDTVLELVDSEDITIHLRFLVDHATAARFGALADRLATAPGFGRTLLLAVAPIQNKAGQKDAKLASKASILTALEAELRDRPYSSQIAYLDWRSLTLYAGLRTGIDELPAAGFYHCEANVDLTCFDHTGHLYACYEAMGDPRMSVGRYWPRVVIDDKELANYRDRSAFSMEQCTSCSLSPICGGGCEVRGIKANGTYMHPYCDGLHEETRHVLRNWPEFARLLGADHAGKG